MREEATFRVKSGLAEMLKGGVIMDVTDAEQAVIAEQAGACAVMALERVPADIRAEGGVARMAPTAKIREIQEAVTIPVMAKARIGHFVEAQVLEALEVDYIDESEVLTPADEANHIDKWAFSVPFVCGATDLGEALRRIAEGAAMIRTKGEAGTGNVVEAVRHMRAIQSGIRRLASMDRSELPAAAKELRAPLELVRKVAAEGGLPVVNFSAGGLATPADAALMMQLGAEGVFVGSGIFKSSDPPARARAIVHATTHYEDPRAIAEASESLGEAMAGPRRQGPGRGQPAPASWLVASRRRRRPASRPPRARGSACSPSRAASRPTATRCGASARVPAEVRRPGTWTRSTGCHPRRGEHDDEHRDRGLRPRAAHPGLRGAADGPCSAPAPG